MSNRRETLLGRMAIIRRDGLNCGLSGCPVGNWPETAQAMRRLSDELPHRHARAYTIEQLVAACYIVDAAGRYQWLNHFEARPARS